MAQAIYKAHNFPIVDPSYMSSVKRPLSPHLGIYRPQISSVMSILHRITGVALAVGSVLMVVWLWSAAYAPAFYTQLHDLLASLPGKLLLLGWTIAFYYHLCNGIRHLWWDMGKGMDVPAVNRSGIVALVATALLTAFTWGMALSAGVQ